MATDADLRLGAKRDRVRHLEEQLEAARGERDEEIRACLRDKLPPTDIARAAGLSRQAVYDLRDAPAGE